MVSSSSTAQRSSSPGLWDCRVHVTGRTGIESTQFAFTDLALRAVPELRAALDAVVTSVRELRGLGIAPAKAVEEGVIDGLAIYGRSRAEPGRRTCRPPRDALEWVHQLAAKAGERSPRVREHSSSRAAAGRRTHVKVPVTAAEMDHPIPLNPGVLTNGFLFTSGFGPQDPSTVSMPDGIREQTRATLANVKPVLADAGLGLSDVVKVASYLREIDRDFAACNEVYAGVMPDPVRRARLSGRI
ncbi:RidA family protein [Sciscionella sediminilitoris]|uniref:RidA family protein n=1 Tax=Sciscionella sediminilitoris TaxID=1445613 RepID=UPI0009EA0A46|nr:RidA family protein [Sciscionella sp. SE31]